MTILDTTTVHSPLDERAQSILGALEYQMRTRPGDLAVSTVGGGPELTYGDLDRRSAAVAGHLIRLGVTRGAPVGVVGRRNPELVVAVLAVLRCGGAYVPLDVAAPERRLRDQLGAVGAGFVVGEAEAVAAVPQGPWVVLGTDAGAATAEVEDGEVVDLPAIRRRAEDTAYVLFTSGSSGTPKGVSVTDGCLAAYVRWACGAYCFEPGGQSLVHSPLTFDFTVTTLLCPLVTGGSLALVPDDSRDALLAALAGPTRYDVIKLTPAHLELVGRMVDPLRLAGRARTVIVGGEALRWCQLLPWQTADPEATFVNEYGPTETTVGCIARWVQPGERGRGPVPIGNPVAGATVRLVDRDGHEVPAGEVGEIEIGGPGVARGYVGAAPLDEARFVHRPDGGRAYRSGDLGREVDGEYSYLGRVDDQIKVRGHRIEPAEIEAVLAEHPAVTAVAVTAPSRRISGRRLVAHVVATAESVSLEQLRAHAAARLPAHMVPTDFTRIDELPLTVNGKVDRRALPALGRDRPQLLQPYEPPRDGLEIALARICAEVLELSLLGREDDVFEVGADSLLIAELSEQVEEELGVVLTLDDVFDHTTVARLAELVRSRTNAGDRL